jgi:hypothetical protein
MKWLRGEAVANPKIPHFVRNRLRIAYSWSKIATLPLVARNDRVRAFNAFVLVTKE